MIQSRKRRKSPIVDWAIVNVLNTFDRKSSAPIVTNAGGRSAQSSSVIVMIGAAPNARWAAFPAFA